MNFLDTTVGSTHAVNNAVTLYLPPEHATTVLAICDREQAAQAEVARLQAEVQRLTPDHAHARDVRSADLEALVLLALSNATLHAAVMAVHHCFRTTKVIDHLREFKDRYGITKPPCRVTVGEILLKHGY
ncbi:hypothetical protein [Pseudomonas fluorescens]|uniref:hypothetical protein n=1 Tax=Pseudomonas fluorescens TaxID=294 RepID=UPI0017841628|nr:hypothetical protein [Pseudomonas fluorescens]